MDEYKTLVNQKLFFKELMQKREDAWDGRVESKEDEFGYGNTREMIERLVFPPLNELATREFSLVLGTCPMEEEDAEEISNVAAEIKWMLCAYVDALVTMYCQYGLTCFPPESKRDKAKEKGDQLRDGTPEGAG